jgi:hypothetical protein
LFRSEKPILRKLRHWGPYTGMTGKPKKTGKQAAKPLSLYGTKPEDALRRALSTPPPKPAKKTPKKG